jgi:UDP-GlcNAc3NAcA epimerase
VLFPAHPRTRAALGSNTVLLGPHVRLLDPLGYLDLAALASQARVILTDSGGLQKEAYWYGVPCVTMRPSTEWVDTVELGANTLVDDDPDRIVTAVADARMPDDRPALYGDGRASDRIADLLVTLSA